MKSKQIYFYFLLTFFVAFTFNCKAENWTKDPNFEIIGKDTVYRLVEDMPQFSGGDAKLIRFISENQYHLKPEDDNGPFGKVIVQFIVRATGKITNLEVKRSPDPFLTKDAIRVIKLLPNFIPGKLKGRKVNVFYVLPFSYRLN